MFQGLRTVVYHVPDLAAATTWYTRILGMEPYFAEPFYVGFNIGGYELGLDPDLSSGGPGAGGVIACWGVADADQVLARLLELGAGAHQPVQDVGGGIRIASVTDPYGNIIGVLENPHFVPGQAG